MTRAQGSAVVVLANHSSDGSDVPLWVGNQWVSSEHRNSDLLFWALLEHDDGDSFQHMSWTDGIDLP